MNEAAVDAALDGLFGYRRWIGAGDLAATVSAMRADFSAAHIAMAKKTGRNRAAYVARIQKRVGRMRKETATDLEGARRAWFGKGV